jgi:hypothetical protein
VSVQEHTFDPTVITPGVVAFVGGFILFGLGLAVRQLGRIEQVLAARPNASTVRPEVAVVSVAASEQPSALAVSLPPEPAAESTAKPELPGIAAAPMTAAALEAERLREKFPSLLRLENAPVVEETVVSLSPKPPVRADEEVADATSIRVERQVNGAAPAPILPQIGVNARSVSRPDQVKNFEAFWPKRRRPGPAGQAAAVQPEMPTPNTEQASVAKPAAAAPEAATPVSILKSGVVDGMTYTLYSDGSIEAQLPQGTLRFGSIAELRNHIEQSA